MSCKKIILVILLLTLSTIALFTNMRHEELVKKNKIIFNNLKFYGISTGSSFFVTDVGFRYGLTVSGPNCRVVERWLADESNCRALLSFTEVKMEKIRALFNDKILREVIKEFRK